MKYQFLDENMEEDELSEEDSIDAIVESIKAQLDVFIDQIGEEKKIIQCMESALDSYSVKYESYEAEERGIKMKFNRNNKMFNMDIVVDYPKVEFRLVFPFRIQCNAFALAALYIAQFNEGKAFSQLNINSENGELFMDYVYLFDSAEAFNEEHFRVCFGALIKNAEEEYVRLNDIAAGKVPENLRILYKTLLEQSLDVIH